MPATVEVPQPGQTNGSGARRRAWRAFRWAGRFNWLTFLFKSKAELAVVIGAAAVVSAGAGMILRDALESRRTARTPVAVERVGPDAQAFTIGGTDDAGRRGRFLVLIMHKGIGWVHKSTTELARDGQTLPAARITDEILGGDVGARLARAQQVIAVGTASQEGDVAEETHRAGKRAQQTAAWVETALPKGTPLWTLNLGQYREPCVECETGDTSWQRPFVLIAVETLDSGTDLGGALASALSSRSNLPSPAAYSAYGLTRVR